MFKRFPVAGRSLIANSVLLSITLVVVTAAAVAGIVLQAVSSHVEQAADSRLLDGSVLFRALLDDTRQDLLAVAEWVAHDEGLLAAVEGNQPDIVRERLAFALRLRAMDEALVASTTGDVAVRLRVDGPQERLGNIGAEPGFRLAMAGQTAYGMSRDGNGGFLQQRVYIPISHPGRERPSAVLRIASFLNEKDLDDFRTHTGLHISLFFGQTRVVTTLRQPDGRPLGEVGPDPDIYQSVVEDGRELVASRDLPTFRVRSYYMPLSGPGNDRVGMVSIAVPVNTIEGDLRQVVLPLLPVTLGIILAGAALAYLLARGVRQPVLLLASAASRLRDGDLSTPVPLVREPDLSALAEQLELARASVKTHLETVTSAQARLRSVFAALSEPIITTSSDGRITDFNWGTVDLFGTEDLLQRPIRELLPFLIPPVLTPPEAQISTPPEARTECETWQGGIVNQAGRNVDLEVHRTRIPDGQLPALDLYALHDVSRHADLSRFREQLLYNVAHELRGPLAVLENALEILSTEYGDLSTAEFDGLMHTSRRTVVRIRSLMEDLLSAGSIQAGRFQVHAEPIGLSAVLNEALDLVGPMLEGYGQRVQRLPAADGVQLLADRRYLRQVLSNLLSNASKYSPEGTTIRVETVRVDGQVRVSVQDEGPGIPLDQQSGLFDRFYRLRAGSEQPGIGLGLAIAKGIIDAHGGHIGVESEVGEGTTVWFTLPVAPEFEE